MSSGPLTTFRACSWPSPPDRVVGRPVSHQQAHHSKRRNQGVLDFNLGPRLPPTRRRGALGKPHAVPEVPAAGTRVLTLRAARPARGGKRV